MVLLLVASVALVVRQQRQVQEQGALAAMNEALRRERGNADAANLAKSQFLANMSHELRTPFNGILGMLQILQSTGLSRRQQDCASKMERATASLLALVNDILDFSKVESGKLELNLEPFRLDRLLRDVSEILSAGTGAGSGQVDVMYDIDPGLPAVLQGDALKLQQVLINLASNALKFTPQGFVVLAVRWLDGAPGQAARVEFSVRDSGIGIASAHQAHIFSAFTQAEASTTRQYGGTGLGLAISRRLVELMGGKLALQSTPGSGSCFSFALQLPAPATATPDRGDGLPALALPAAHMRVLAVDDNPVSQDIVGRICGHWGWPVTLADSAAAALALVQQGHAAQQPFQLILLDWHLPGMDGWALVRSIRQLALPEGSPPPTIVMLTGTGRDRLAQQPEQDQGLLNAVLVRPFTATQLREAALDGGAPESRLRRSQRRRGRGNRLAGIRVLVVEDNRLNQQVAQELLSLEGAQVAIAANGQLGVEAVLAADPPFHVVLMDLQMPVLDGYGATRAIRQTLDPQQLPIIAMTANAMASDREACLAAGMNEHIGKPFDLGKLVSLLIRSTGAMPSAPPQAADTEPDAAPLPELAGLDLDGLDVDGLDVDGLDVAGALMRMSGLRPLYVRAAQDFSASLDGLVPALRATLHAGDLAALRRQLHTLKGNAATLGANALSQQAAALEALHHSGFPAGRCEALLQVLEPLASSTRASLQRAMERLDDRAPADATQAGGATLDWPAARTVLLELVALLKNADMDALLCFAQGRSALEPLPADFCTQLDLALQDLELESALSLCNAALADGAAVPA
jgi:signal transduction histidine kinase/DNA-binding response OmpR family regulator/HPt (histidine-containing phosphotransfer) domain-containing protein